MNGNNAAYTPANLDQSIITHRTSFMCNLKYIAQLLFKLLGNIENFLTDPRTSMPHAAQYANIQTQIKRWSVAKALVFHSRCCMPLTGIGTY